MPISFVTRTAAAVVILLNLALLTVLLEAKETKLRYALVKKQEAAARVAQDNRVLMLNVAQGKRDVARQAAEYGMRPGSRKK